jgi:hypothetical protein
MIIINVERKINSSGQRMWKATKVEMLGKDEVPMVYKQPSLRNDRIMFRDIGYERCFKLPSGHIRFYSSKNEEGHLRVGEWIHIARFQQILHIIREAGTNLTKINQRVRAVRNIADTSPITIKI